MNWNVIWVPDAEQELAARWLSSSNRAAVTAAAHAIDQALATDPDHKGESRSGGRRILLEPPLGVSFWVDEPNHTVYVLNVWEFRIGPPQGQP